MANCLAQVRPGVPVGVKCNAVLRATAGASRSAPGRIDHAMNIIMQWSARHAVAAQGGLLKTYGHETGASEASNGTFSAGSLAGLAAVAPSG
jgi:hypothetical protein